MRAFWPVASISVALAVLYTLGALWVTFNPASGCTVDGQPCASFGIANLAFYIGVPPLSLLAVVLIGARLRRHSPRAALAWVASPLMVIVAVVAANVMGAGA